MNRTDVKTMRTWSVETASGPFLEKECALRPVQQGQVLVRILASGINPLDTKIRAGLAAHARQPLPAILGLDMAGVVEAVGEGVDTFQAGDEVYGMVGGVGGHQGTLAEFITVDASLLARKPKQLSMRQAAALPLVAITAWEGLVDRATVSADKTVLIHAGAGGVGNLALQLAKAYGARVFATVSPSKREAIEHFGATLIDYTQQSVDDYMSQYTDGAGFDIIYDTLGGSTLDISFLAAKRYTGHVVSCLGWGSHALAPLSFRGATYSGVFSLLPLLTGEGRAHHGEILKRVSELADEGKIEPLLNEQTYSVRELDEAFAAVERGTMGKTVINVA
jgi:NADPH:quinone reductase-like Zn-dependent oxidoreductase